MLRNLFLISVFVTVAGVAWAGDSASVLPEEMDAINILGTNADFSYSRSLPYKSKDMVLFENVIVGSDHYAVLMRWRKNNTFHPVWAGKLRTVEIPFCSIVIDGNDADWAGISPVVEDPAGDENPTYSTVPGTDLANVYLARDDTYLYFRMTFHDGNPTNAIYVVELQQYLTQTHTPGDRWADAVHDGNDWYVQVGDRTGVGIASYPSDYVGVGSAMLEWKVPIIDMQYLSYPPEPYYSPVPSIPGIENQFIQTYIHPFPIPESPVSDENDELTRPMVVNFY